MKQQEFWTVIAKKDDSALFKKLVSIRRIMMDREGSDSAAIRKFLGQWKRLLPKPTNTSEFMAPRPHGLVWYGPRMSFLSKLSFYG